MSLADTKSYTLTAATSGISDLMAALHTHFSSAPGLWQLKSGVGSSSAGIVIVPKVPVSGYDIAISIRRNGTTNFQLALDPLNSYTAAGNASGGPTGGSAQASGDITQIITNIASTKIAVTEYPDAIKLDFYNSGLTVAVQSPHIGRVGDPIRESYRAAPLLCDGLGVLVGYLQLDQATNSSGWQGGTSGASRIRSNGGWRAIEWLQGNPPNGTIPDAPAANKEIVTPISIVVYHDASTNRSPILLSRYFGKAGASRNTRTIIASDTADEAWMHTADGVFNLTASSAVAAWEKGAPAPT